MQNDSASDAHLFESLKEKPPILIRAINPPTLIAPGRDMVDRPFKFNPWCPRHAHNQSASLRNVKCQGPTPNSAPRLSASTPTLRAQPTMRGYSRVTFQRPLRFNKYRNAPPFRAESITATPSFVTRPIDMKYQRPGGGKRPGDPLLTSVLYSGNLVARCCGISLLINKYK